MGIKNFAKKLGRLKGKEVKIRISHKLYGIQNIKYNFQLIDDDNRLGFSINGEAIYIKKNEICNFGAIDNMYYFADKLMRIELQTT